MMNQTILIVDDDRKTVELVRLYLENDGYAVLAAHDGLQAIQAARQQRPDLIVLDLMLPRVDGIEVFNILRAESEIPIIMLTARTTEDDKLLGLNLGADDYITKPFSPREVLARVKAVLRRVSSAENGKDQSQLTLGPLTIDFSRHEAWLHDSSIHLTPKEFKLLEVLARNPGHALSRAELVSYAFGQGYEGLERTIDVHIMNLRKKIETQDETGVKIDTVYGVGYKLVNKSGN
jgi:DNA-binding response OmpR family regulator